MLQEGASVWQQQRDGFPQNFFPLPLIHSLSFICLLLPQVSCHGEPLQLWWSSLPFSWENMKQKHMFLKIFVHLSETMSRNRPSSLLLLPNSTWCTLSSTVILVPAESQLPVFDGTLTHQYCWGCSPQVVWTFVWFQGQMFLEKLQQSLWYLVLDMLSLPWLLRRGCWREAWVPTENRKLQWILRAPHPASSHHMLFILLYLLHFANKERRLAVLHPYLNQSSRPGSPGVWVGDRRPGSWEAV